MRTEGLPPVRLPTAKPATAASTGDKPSAPAGDVSAFTGTAPATASNAPTAEESSRYAELSKAFDLLGQAWNEMVESIKNGPAPTPVAPPSPSAPATPPAIEAAPATPAPEAAPADATAEAAPATAAAPAVSGGGARPLLKIGSSGPEVAELQRKLEAAGFSPQGNDGIYGKNTEAAVKAYQASRNLTADGVVGPQTWGALDASAPSQGGARSLLKKGASGPEVAELQRKLEAAGFSTQGVDGIYGKNTEAAVKSYQRSRNLTADGVVGPQTWGALDANAPSQGGSGPLLKKGHGGDVVKQLQQRLTDLGFNTHGVDGAFGANTDAAVKAFQGSKGLAVDGVVGPNTWKALGIHVQGQPTGGVAPGGAAGGGNSALANAARNVALSMGGYNSQGLCAAGVSRAIKAVYGFTVWGNGNEIDNNLPRDRFRQVDMSLEQALKTPGLILTWEKTSTAAGSIYGHTAITAGDGRTSYSDFIESNTLAGSSGRSGFKVFAPIA